jgi:hypothetical protein
VCGQGADEVRGVEGRARGDDAGGPDPAGAAGGTIGCDPDGSGRGPPHVPRQTTLKHVPKPRGQSTAERSGPSSRRFVPRIRPARKRRPAAQAGEIEGGLPDQAGQRGPVGRESRLTSVTSRNTARLLGCCS